MAMTRPLLGLSFERKAEAFLAQVGATRLDLDQLDAAAIVTWLSGLERGRRAAADAGSAQSEVAGSPAAGG